MQLNHIAIRQRRLELGKTQEHIARRVGIDVRTLRTYETGPVVLLRAEQREIAGALATALEVPLATILLESSSGGAADDVYVHRRTQEGMALELLRRRGTPVAIDGPRDHGKARLVQFLAAAFSERSEGHALRIRLSRFRDDEAADTGRFFQRLGLELLRGAAAPDPEARLQELWNPSLPEQRSLEQILYQHLLTTPSPLLLCFENLDRLFGHPTLGALLRLLRSWVDEDDGVLAQLRLLVTSAVRTDWLDQQEHSPFLSCCALIEVGAFDDRELRDLVDLHRLTPAAPVVAGLRRALGGHPRLSCDLLNRARFEGCAVEEALESRAFVDAALGGRLREKTRWLQQHGLLAAFQRLCAAPGPLPDQDAALLYSQGLIHEPERGVFACRYEVFARGLSPAG